MNLGTSGRSYVLVQVPPVLVLRFGVKVREAGGRPGHRDCAVVRVPGSRKVAFSDMTMSTLFLEVVHGSHRDNCLYK